MKNQLTMIELINDESESINNDQNLSKEDIKEMILQLNDLYDGEFEITLKEK
jgi:hypothetical protein